VRRCSVQALRVEHGADRAFQAKRGLDHGCVIGTRRCAVDLDSQQGGPDTNQADVWNDFKRIADLLQALGTA
jgi:hypothetical protein